MAPRLLDLVGLLAFLFAAAAAFLGWRRARARSAGASSSLRLTVSPLARLFRPARVSDEERLATSLVQAGRREPDALPRFLEEKALYLLGGSAVGLLLAFAVGGRLGLLLLLLIVPLCIVLPERLLRQDAEARARAIERELPSAVDLLVTCLDAGLALDQAIERVGHEMKTAPVLAEELAITAGEYRAGVPFAQALERLGARVRLDELAAMCNMLAQASALGTPIADTLSEYAIASRRQRMAFLEERAGRAATRLTLPVALFLLPAAMLVVLGPALLNLVGALK